MDFPDNWDIDRGVSEHTIICGGIKDSAISLAVNVIELKDMSLSDINIWDLWDIKELDLEGVYRRSMTESVNSEIENINFRKVYVSNIEAIEIKFNYLNKDVDTEYEMQAIVYTVYIIPYIYTIGLHILKMFYYLDIERYNNLIYDFSFIKRK